MSDELKAATERLWLPAQHSQGNATVHASDLYVVLTALEQRTKEADAGASGMAADWSEMKALRADLAKAQARVAELEAICVALLGAIHSEPTMSGHLRNLHISPVRGEPPLRKLKLLMSDTPSSALAAVRLAQRALDEVMGSAAIHGDGRLKDDMRAEILAAEEALREAFGEGE